MRPAGRRPPGRGRGCGHPLQVAPRDAILDRSSAPQTGAGAAKLAAAGPLVERTCLGTRGGERGAAAASLRLAELARRFPPRPDLLCDSGSAAAPPETTRPQPITARLLTSMRLALARAVALTTLKAQRAAPCTLPPLLGGPLPRPSWSWNRTPSALLSFLTPPFSAALFSLPPLGRFPTLSSPALPSCSPVPPYLPLSGCLRVPFLLPAALGSRSARLSGAPFSPPALSFLFLSSPPSPNPHSCRLRLFSLLSIPRPRSHPQPTWGVSDVRWSAPPLQGRTRGPRGEIRAASRPRGGGGPRGSAAAAPRAERGRMPGMRTPGRASCAPPAPREPPAPVRHPVQET